jgi:hypothetical protein
VRIERDIQEVEARIARRRMAVELTGRAVWRRTVKKVVSPVGLLGAAALGALTVVGVFRRNGRGPDKAAKAGKWGSLAGLAASAGFALLKAQYGGPVNIANMVLAKVHAFKQERQRRAPARPAAPRSGANSGYVAR